MSTDDIDPTAPEPGIDGHLVDPDLFDDGDVADLDDAGYDDAGYDDDLYPGEPPAPDLAADEDAVEMLRTTGGPLELTADPTAEAELNRWLDEPSPEVASAAELAVLDRLLRASLAQE